MDFELPVDPIELEGLEREVSVPASGQTAPTDKVGSGRVAEERRTSQPWEALTIILGLTTLRRN